MSNKVAAILSIILGLIIIICPLVGFVTMAWVIALPIIFLGLYALIAGCLGETDFVNIILGILFVIFGIVLFFNPVILSFLSAFFNYFIGILLIVLSIVNLFTKGDGKYASIVGIIFGIIALIFGYLSLYPEFLGLVLGVWLLIAGITKLAIPDAE